MTRGESVAAVTVERGMALVSALLLMAVMSGLVVALTVSSKLEVAIGDNEQLYAGARAVYYAPVDEDYGFSTVEAFASGKPVITTSDAGGVLEFVDDGVTGLVTPPDPARVAESLARVAADPAAGARMGEAGRARVAGITWDHVVDTLLVGAR